jgi:hypothetical protein
MVKSQLDGIIPAQTLARNSVSSRRPSVDGRHASPIRCAAEKSSPPHIHDQECLHVGEEQGLWTTLLKLCSLKKLGSLPVPPENAPRPEGSAGIVSGGRRHLDTYWYGSIRAFICSKTGENIWDNQVLDKVH